MQSKRIAPMVLLTFLGLVMMTAPLASAADFEALVASTLIGGSHLDGYYETPCAYDAQGNVFVAGRTSSGNFPTTPGACHESFLGGNSDVFVAKFDPSLGTLLASTFLGGSLEEAPWPGVALAVDEAGRVFVATPTWSSDCPTPDGAYNTTTNGNFDVWIARLDNNLSTIEAATYVGSPLAENYLRLAINDSGDLFVAGHTGFRMYPTTDGAWDTSFNGGFDVFVSRFDPDLTTLQASTFIGGTGNEYLEALVLDGAGRIYVTGWTASINYPVTASGQLEPGDNTWDAFVSCLDEDLTTLRGSTYLGGTAWDFGYAMAVGPDLTVYVTGHTASGDDFPVTPDSYNPTYIGTGGEGTGDDAFVTRYSPDLTTIIASTYLGGSRWEIGLGMAVDTQGRVYLGGGTGSTDWPVPAGSLDEVAAGGSVHTGEGWLVRLDAELAHLEAATYLGGSENDNLTHLVIEPDGHLLVSGTTSSTDFPTTDQAWDQIHNGGVHEYAGDVFVARIDPGMGTEPVPCILQAFDADWRGDHYSLRLKLGGTVTPEQLRLSCRQGSHNREVALFRVAETLYTAEDRPVAGQGDDIVYYLHARDAQGRWLLLAEKAAPPQQVPFRTRLVSTAPNPFNPRITVRFALDKPGNVRLRVLDATGRRVSLLGGTSYPAGEHEVVWDGRDADGRAMPSGIYLVELRADGCRQMEKITLLR